MSQFRKLLVPLDGSDLAERVFPYAETLARMSNAEITLLQVAPTASSLVALAATPAPEAVDYVAIAKKIRGEATTYLTSAAERLGARGLNVRHLVVEGTAAAEITRLARDLGTELIAMTTHGRGGIERVVFGSVADEVVRTAPCPIFLVPLRKENASRQGVAA
jgi:nucleotide-binding universal stress UspA family protein